MTNLKALFNFAMHYTLEVRKGCLDNRKIICLLNVYIKKHVLNNSLYFIIKT